MKTKRSSEITGIQGGQKGDGEGETYRLPPATKGRRRTTKRHGKGEGMTLEQTQKCPVKRGSLMEDEAPRGYNKRKKETNATS